MRKMAAAFAYISHCISKQIIVCEHYGTFLKVMIMALCECKFLFFQVQARDWTWDFVPPSLHMKNITCHFTYCVNHFYS